MFSLSDPDFSLYRYAYDYHARRNQKCANGVLVVNDNGVDGLTHGDLGAR